MKIVIAKVRSFCPYAELRLTQKAILRLIELGMRVVKRDDLTEHEPTHGIIDYEGTNIMKNAMGEVDKDQGRYDLINHNDNYESYQTDERVIQVVEELGLDAWIDSPLVVVEIPDGIDWYLEKPFGESQYIAEKHRTWRG